MVDWENALHLRRVQPPEAAATAPIVSTVQISADSIRDYLCKRFPAWPNVRVSNLQRPSGGFSKITVLFDVEDDHNGLQSLVIRAEQPLNLVFLEGADLENEFHVLRLASAAGLPVAQPLWFEEDAKRLGARFLVSRRAKGRNFGSRVDVRERISESLLRNVVGRLVQLHQTPIDPAAPNAAASHLGRWAKYRTLRECVAAQVSFWQEGANKFRIPPSPIVSRTFGWLERNIPDNDDPPVLLHGDFGLHNLLIGDDETVSCILDWEAATLGDPVDDVVWLSEGLRGSVERDRIISLYEELGGRPINKMRLPFFDVMCSMRFAVTCPRALDLFEQHPRAGLEALQLGLLYMYHGTGALNRHIERADEAQAAR
jgi:aminoglycoside phosphotransferase (APT) family kinase protein